MIFINGYETFFYPLLFALIMKGTYILLMILDKNHFIQIGKQGIYEFRKGWYVYIGSALNNLESRIERHKRLEKKFHWHIDYLLKYAQMKKVFIQQGTTKQECHIASLFAIKFDAIPSFGSSDCSCRSHLYMGDEKDFLSMMQMIQFTEL